MNQNEVTEQVNKTSLFNQCMTEHLLQNEACVAMQKTINICLERNRLQNNLCIITFNIIQYDYFTFPVDVLLSNTSTNTGNAAATSYPIATITTRAPESPLFSYYNIVLRHVRQKWERQEGNKFTPNARQICNRDSHFINK